MSTKFSGRKIWLAIELTLIFIGIPILLTVQSRIVHPSMIVLPLLILLILALRKQPDFKLKDLIKLNIPKQDWLKHLGLVALAWLSLLAYTWLVEPENVFNLPKKNLRVWLIIITLYPLFSAYGQEVIFRLFMHLRYRPLLGDRHVFIIASATLFSFAHVIYYSPLSIILTFIAGVYLAWVYLRTRSVLFVGILHGLLGNAVFTVGLGQHFWVDITRFL